MTATQSNKASVKAGLFDRLKSGPVICAEGYLFELERRGYLQAGGLIPLSQASLYVVAAAV